MQVGDKAWIPASLTQARYNIPGELMYGNGRPIYIPVIVNGVESNGSANVVLEWDGSVKLNVKFKDIQPRSSIDGPTPDDLIQLEYPNEGSILYLLGDHFRRSHFLCRLGRSFIWINPAYRNVREIGGHRNAVADMSARLTSTSQVDIYSIAEEVRKTVAENLMNLSVIFRGMSGSGKTELSKFTMQYLLFASSPRHDRAVTDHPNYIPLGHGSNQFLTSTSCEVSKAAAIGSLLLDAFGTSPTEKNPSSSRLLRITKMQYDLRGSLRGVEFLYQQLDSSRISAHNINESHPYNIFSWIVVGAPPNLKEELKFTAGMISEFETCASTTSPTYLEECQRNFSYLQHLLNSLGVSDVVWTDIIKVLAAILHLQRLVVSGSDAATISAATKNHVGYAESILGLDQGTLGPTLLKRAVDMHGTKTFKNLSQEDSTLAIFTLSSELYMRTFDYLLRLCNNHAPITPNSGGPLVQLIDVSGSEIFPVNNLSQLIIHMTEEKMNEYMIYRSFQREVEFLRNEGVEAPPVGNVVDCEPILLLLEKPPISIFHLLEEACLLPRGNDNALLDKILSTHSKGKLVRTGGRQAKSTCFIIKHNFGDAMYDIDGFINSNRSRITGDAKILLTTVLCEKFTFLRTEQDSHKDEDEAPAPGRRKTDKTLNKNLFTANFARDQLKLLLDSIHGSEVDGTADPLIIFCVRASSDIKTLTFDPSYAAPQMDFLNLSPLATFAKKGFAQRYLYKEFYERYRVMFSYVYKDLPWKFPPVVVNNHTSNSSHEGKVLCKQLLEECAILGCLPHLFHDESIAPVFGNTFLFTHSRLVEIIENLRGQTLQKYSRAAIILQSTIRMKKQSTLYKKTVQSTLLIQTKYRGYRNQSTYRSQLRSIKLIQTVYKMKLLHRKYKQMKSAILKIERSYYNKIQFFRYNKIKRGLASLHSLVRGYVLRQQINHIIRAILKLQHFAKDFLKRNHLFYYRRVAIVIIQKVFRGSYCRHLNKPIVRALKIRRNQRIGTAAVKKLQARYRMLRIRRRFQEIIEAARCIRSWAMARKQRAEYLQILFLAKWLQSVARRVIAVNMVNNLRVNQMLLEEFEHMNSIRNRELQCVHYSSSENLMNIRVGGGYYKNAQEKFNRYVIAFDLNFDISLAYPQGWIQTIMKFNQQLRQNGQKRLAKIAIGKNHTVLVDSSSGVYTFGLGDSGQLGHGTKSNEISPRYLDTLLYQANNVEAGLSKSLSSRVEVLSICTGCDHTLLLSGTRRVYSWGSNRRGQLGHSEFHDSSLPRLVVGPKNVRVISCGSYHSACLADPGILHTWGARECLGRKSDTDCSEAHSLPFFQKKRVQLLVCGDTHVAVRAGSDFYSWGLNTYGQLGIGEAESLSEGQGESKGHHDDDAGDDDTVDSEMQHSNQREVLKMKRGKNSVLPCRVLLPSISWSEADLMECQLVAGGRHMLLTLRNRVWCWGWNKYGQVGDGTAVNAYVPHEVALEGPKVLIPSERLTQKISTNATRIVSAIAGWRHSSILTKGGVTYVWGFPQLHSSCTTEIPTNSRSQADNSSNPITPLLVPHILVLPQALSSMPTTTTSLTPILGLFSCSSSSFSLTAVEVVEIDVPPPQSLQKTKYNSQRKVDTLEFHNTAKIQREIKQRMREELGPWSRSAYNTNHPIVFEKSDESVASSSSSVYNRKGWGIDKVNSPLKSSKPLMSPSKPKVMESDVTIPNINRRNEGQLTHEGLLKLFSPLKSNDYPSDYNQSLDGLDINIDDYFNIPADDDDLKDNMIGKNPREEGHLNSNMSLSSLQRKRRSSVATILHPDDEDAEQLSLHSKQSLRRASLARVNEKTRASNSQSLTSKDANISQTRPTPKVESELDSLLRSRKELPSKTRKSPLETSSASSSKRKKESKGKSLMPPADRDEGALSHIAVSDLAPMIQSIKKESLQQMSMSWRV